MDQDSALAGMLGNVCNNKKTLYSRTKNMEEYGWLRSDFPNDLIQQLKEESFMSFSETAISFSLPVTSVLA